MHYYIRESYQDGDAFLSRDLIDLGTDPAEYIIYPGGNAFYIDTAVEEHLDKLGVTLQENDLENIFWRFLDPDIQRALEYFRHRENRSRTGHKSTEKSENLEFLVHIFDKRRLHNQKFGRMSRVICGLYRKNFLIFCATNPEMRLNNNFWTWNSS